MKIYREQIPQNLKLKIFLPKFSKTSTPLICMKSTLQHQKDFESLFLLIFVERMSLCGATDTPVWT